MVFFSIVLPVFNREKTVSNAIHSVLEQTFINWELLVIDDCSTDSTVNEISKFHDLRIRFFQNSINLGPAISRNRGIHQSKGEIICFLDSDDRFYPDFLKKVNLLYQTSSKQIGFSWTGLEVKYRNGVKIEIWNPEIQVSPYYTFLKSLRIGTNSGLSVKKEVFEACGLFNEELSAAEDTELLLRIVQKFGFKVIQEPLIFIDKSGNDRLSLNYIKNAKSYNLFISQHWGFINKYPELKRKYLYKLMWLNYHLGEIKKAREFKKQFAMSFGFSIKVFVIQILFEVFGVKIGSKIHVFLSK